MPGKARPSLRAKTLYNVERSNLNRTDKECIKAVFEMVGNDDKMHWMNKAHWEREGEKLTCSKCGNWYITNMSPFPYCARCGAKMNDKIKEPTEN